MKHLVLRLGVLTGLFCIALIWSAFFASFVSSAASDVGAGQGTSGNVQRQNDEAGAENSDNLQRQYDEAVQLLDAARFNEAQAMFTQILKEAPPESGQIIVAKTCNKLGCLYRVLRRYDDSEACFNRSYKMFNSLKDSAGNALPADPLKLAAVLNNLGKLYADFGDFPKARDSYQKSLDIFERQEDAAPGSRITVLANLSDLYRKFQWSERAATSVQQAIATAEKAYGLDSYLLLPLLDAQAALLRATSEGEKSLVVQQRALNIAEQAYGCNVSETANRLNELALTYWELGKRRNALAALERSVDISEKTLIPAHPNRPVFLYNLALAYRELGLYREAQPLFDRAIELVNRQRYPTVLKERLYVARAVLFSQTNRVPRAYEDLKRATELAFEPKLALTTGKEGAVSYRLLKESNNLFTLSLQLQDESLHNMNEAYLAMEQARAYELLSAAPLQRADLSLVDPLTRAKLIREENSAQVEVLCLEARAEAIERMGKSSDADRTEWEILITKLLPHAYKRTVDASEAIRRAVPVMGQVSESGGKPIPFTLIQNKLTAVDTIALEYKIDNNRGYLLAYGSGMARPRLYPLKINVQQAKQLGLEEKNGQAAWLTNDLLRRILSSSAGRSIRKLPENETEAKAAGTLNSPDRINTFWTILLPDPKLEKTVLAQKKVLFLRDGLLAELTFDNFIVKSGANGEPSTRLKEGKRLKDCGLEIRYLYSAKELY